MSSAVTSAVARDQFEIIYPTIRGFLLSQFEAHSMPQDAIEYFTRVCHLLFRRATKTHLIMQQLKKKVS
jgi:hypothetical protein